MRRVKWVRQEPKILGVSLDVFPLMLIIIVAVTLVGLYFLLNVATSAIFAILFVDAVIYILF